MEGKVSSPERRVFFIAIFIAGLCSIIYELLISTTSSYFLGDSIKQFSLTIGVYMAAMGIGSYFTKGFEKNLLDRFVQVEVLLGLIGGASVPILYFAFDRLSTDMYQLLMLGLTMLIGVLTGFEVPLLIRMMKEYYPLKTNLANVLSLDYIGALIATLLFPFLLLPFLGTFRISILFGLINIGLGVYVYYFFTRQLSMKKKRWLEATIVSCVLFFALLGSFSGKLLKHWEENFFLSKVIYSKETPYQHLVLTQNKEDIRLYINRIIQFSSLDEYRYHEALALVPLSAAPYKKKALILGGGEGLLARELLKHADFEEITIVDLDPTVFEIAKNNHYLKEINENAMNHPSIKLEAQDAMQFLKNTNERFDVIIADLPDPSNEAVARLYSTAFYKLANAALTKYGVFATQASGVFHTNNAFWCIHETIKATGFKEVYPYHTYVPSFGDWGFIVAANHPIEPRALKLTQPTQFLETNMGKDLFSFEKDIDNPGDIEINHLDRPVLLEYYLDEWEVWRKEKQ